MTGKRDHGDGGIDERGPDRWRLRWRVDGKRYTKAFHGTKRAAQTELRRLLKSADDGAHVAPSKVTIAASLRRWLDSDTDLSPKTLERYRQLAEHQIIPHLGATVLQDLRPAQIAAWHAQLLKSGAVDGGALSTRTVGAAHRVLSRYLTLAVRREVVSRNVASAAPPPKVDAREVEILTPDQIVDILDRLAGHTLYPIAVMALGTGMRRGELCGLAWGALDLDKAVVRVERSIEQTGAGLRAKAPKTKHAARSACRRTS